MKAKRIERSAKSEELRASGKDSVLYTLCSMLISLCLAGCGYTLQSRATLPFNSIQIQGIENKTVEPKLHDMFYRAVTEEFLKHGISVQSHADYKLSGTINRYKLNVLSERSGVAVEYEVIIKGDFRLVGPSGNTKDIKNIGSPFIVSFPVSGPLEDVLAFKELASERAIRDMAMEVVGAFIY
jgi:Lipopolysaccharide-assembly